MVGWKPAWATVMTTATASADDPKGRGQDLRCWLCPLPIRVTASKRDTNAEPFVVTSLFRSDGTQVRTAEGRPVPVYAHAACWYAPDQPKQDQPASAPVSDPEPEAKDR